MKADIYRHRKIGVRCYDFGDSTFDRHTVVYTGRYRHLTCGEQRYVGMSANPYHPQGFGQHCSTSIYIDSPSYKHLGKRISFDALPPDCQRLVKDDCLYLATDYGD